MLYIILLTKLTESENQIVREWWFNELERNPIEKFAMNKERSNFAFENKSLRRRFL